jgi:hypothetical protein
MGVMKQEQIDSMVGKRVVLNCDLIALPKGTAGIVVKIPRGQCYKPDFPLVRFDNGVERIVSPNAFT